MTAQTCLRAAVVAVLIAAPSYADEQSAKDYVNQAETLANGNDAEGAKAKLDLAEAELDSVTGGGKQPLADRIAALKAKLAASAGAADKDKYTRKLKSAMDDAEGAIGNLVTWPGAETAINDVFNDADAKAAIGPDLAAAQKKFATFKRLNAKKAEVQLSAAAEENVKTFEAAWAAAKPKIVSPATPGDKDTAITDMDHAITEVRRTLGGFAPDSDAGKAFNARVDKVANEYTGLALADQVKDKAKQLADSWDSYKDDWTGWQDEKAGPTLADYTAKQGGAMDQLNCPKTVALLSRSKQWLDNRKDDEDYKKFASSPEVKAVVDKIVADQAAAIAKMQKFSESILTEAEAKKPLDDNTKQAVSRFADSVKNNLEGSDQIDAVTARANRIMTGAAVGDDAKAAATAAFYKDATAKAAADWPAMKAKFTTVDGFDPNAAGDLKGKLVVIETDNLMGYRFNTGDFPFATTVNGVPVAGKFDPAVAAAVKDVQAKLGRSLGDDDNDGKWTVIAKVTGETGKLSKRVNVEGKIKDDAGNTATVTGERAETVDAPVVTIVAAHCGPLAVAADAP